MGMESTGVYWVPVYAVLEGYFELIVGNAGHMKNVPGRKTDVQDSQWIAELIRCGLIRKSFVPPKWQRALRDLTRYRRKLVEAQGKRTEPAAAPAGDLQREVGIGSQRRFRQVGP